jgi:NADH:ubiquinone reductase (H+-translocating)
MRPRTRPTSPPSLPSVVIVGGGFAGLTLIQHLRDAPVNIVLIDRCNHHLFQPLLYQVATAALAPHLPTPLRLAVFADSRARWVVLSLSV